MGKKGGEHTSKQGKASANGLKAAKKGAAMASPLPAPTTEDITLQQKRTKPALQPKGLPLAQQPLVSQGPALQMKALDPPSAGATKKNVAAKVWYQAGPDRQSPFYWEFDSGDVDDRNELLKKIAGDAAGVGADIASRVNGQWTANSNNHADMNTYNPLMVQYIGQYKTAKGQKPVALDYHYGERWHGYVVKVVDGEKKMNHAMTDGVVGGGQYSNRHAADTSDSRNRQTSIARDADASPDAVTKLTGEGARWQCIRDSIGFVRDNSRIFTNENAAGTLTPNVRSIPFHKLWKSWDGQFAKKFNIANAEMVTALKGKDIQLSTGTYDVDASETASSNMKHHYDINVDTPPHASSAELGINTVEYLHYKRGGIGVAKSVKTLSNEQNLFLKELGKEKLAPKDNIIGYTGNDSFAVLVERTQNDQALVPVLTGYTRLAHTVPEMSYPIYRKDKVKTQGKTGALWTAIGNGAALYAKERKDAYDAVIETAVTKLIALNSRYIGTDKASLTKHVSEKLLKWEGVDRRLPISDLAPLLEAGDRKEQHRKLKGNYVIPAPAPAKKVVATGPTGPPGGAGTTSASASNTSGAI